MSPGSHDDVRREGDGVTQGRRHVVRRRMEGPCDRVSEDGGDRISGPHGVHRPGPGGDRDPRHGSRSGDHAQTGCTLGDHQGDDSGRVKGWPPLVGGSEPQERQVVLTHLDHNGGCGQAKEPPDELAVITDEAGPGIGVQHETMPPADDPPEEGIDLRGIVEGKGRHHDRTLRSQVGIEVIIDPKGAVTDGPAERVTRLAIHPFGCRPPGRVGIPNAVQIDAPRSRHTSQMGAGRIVGHLGHEQGRSAEGNEVDGDIEPGAPGIANRPTAGGTLVHQLVHQQVADHDRRRGGASRCRGGRRTHGAVRRGDGPPRGAYRTRGLTGHRNDDGTDDREAVRIRMRASPLSLRRTWGAIRCFAESVVEGEHSHRGGHRHHDWWRVGRVGAANDARSTVDRPPHTATPQPSALRHPPTPPDRDRGTADVVGTHPRR